MTIFGVALLAICTLIGRVHNGDLLGVALQVKAMSAALAIAMMLLIARACLADAPGWTAARH